MNKRIKEIQLIVSDFDGVMTDNNVYLDQNGIEYVSVSRADGYGIQILKELGYAILIISSEQNPVVSERAKKLNIDVIQGSKNKVICLNNFLTMNKITSDKVLYIGNDMNDFDVMKSVGLCASPKDAHIIIRKISDIKLKTSGGHGVIRELAERISYMSKRHKTTWYKDYFISLFKFKL
jgi:YrbI family 3-deoxy-D-manno-octulosonate 8-phosphate phosphatase